MKGFWEIAKLEARRLVRSKAAIMLAAAAVMWIVAFPHVALGDGTAEGARELYLHYGLGGVFALVILALAASGAGSLARERDAKRLPLTVVRPVTGFTIALARTFTFTAFGAAILALTAGIALAHVGASRSSWSVRGPVMESPRAEAEKAYAMYMASESTPEEVKKAPKDVVLRLLTEKARDNYETIATNHTAKWKFRPVPVGSVVAARLKFTNAFDARDIVVGDLAFDAYAGSISNVTRSAAVVPLSPVAERTVNDENDLRELTFLNKGKGTLMLRPRQDVELLVEADSFKWNLLRAWLELVSILGAATAFAVFLSAALGRGVAVFTLVGTLLVAFVSSDVIERYPDQLETEKVDRIGLMITRTAETVTRPVAALSPLGALSADERIEPEETARAIAVDGFIFPLVFALLSGLVISRKIN